MVFFKPGFRHAMVRLGLLCLAVILVVLLRTQAVFCTEIRVGVYQNQPLIFQDPDSGQIKGLFADLLAYVARREGWHLQFVPCDWHQCLQMLAKGEIDLLPAIAYSRQRAERFAFTSQSLLTNWGAVYVSPNSPLKSLLDLQGAVIAVLKDDIYYNALLDLLMKFNLGCTFVETSSYSEVMEAVAEAKADAGVVNRIYGNLNGYRFNLVRSGMVFSPIGLRVAAPRNSAELLAAIDVHLKELKENRDSAYYRWIDTWIGGRQPFSLPAWIKGLGIFLGAAALILAMVSLLLRAQVKARNAELLESQARLQAFFDNSSTGCAVWDSARRFVRANRLMAKLLGLSEGDILGRTCRQLNPDLAASIEPIIEEVLEKGIVRHAVPLTVGDSHEMGPVHMLASFFPLPAGTSRQEVGCMAVDVTERRQLEEQLLQARKMEAIGTLAGGIAHDFNNILGIILGNSELLAVEQDCLQEHCRGYVRAIKEACLRARDVVLQLLNFSRKSVMSKKPVALWPLIEDTLKLLRASIPASIEIKADTPARQDIVMADPVQIQQLLLNLATNACQAMGEDGGVLTIDLQPVGIDHNGNEEFAFLTAGRWLQLTVADTGPGIEPAIMKHIFEPYFTTRQNDQGTGMGLAVVHGIVKSHGGHIRVQSEPGRGTRVLVFFPRI